MELKYVEDDIISNKSYPFANDKPQLFILNILQNRKINIKDFRNLCKNAFNNIGYTNNITGKINYVISILLGSRRIKYDYFKFIVEDVLNEKFPDDDKLIWYITYQNFNDVSGKRFGRLVPLRPIGTNNDGNIVWLCKCDCGNETNVKLSYLTSGHTKSCSCIHKENQRKRLTTHNMSKTSEFTIWHGMNQRCYNSNNTHYKDYGGRGITICDRWRDSFENFYEDMGDRPEGMSIDRIDNDGNYEPSNCRWATAKEQNRNQHNNIIFQDGDFLIDWVKDVGICYEFARKYFHKGFTKDEIYNKYIESLKMIANGIRDTCGRFVKNKKRGRSWN